MNPRVTSAGGLVVIVGPPIRVMLVANGEPAGWRIPKGMTEEDETLEQTAIREVAEEAGVLGRVVMKLGIAAWTYCYDGRDWDETCHFYLMSLVRMTPELRDNEYSTAAWVSAEAACSLLQHAEERRIARRALVRSMHLSGELT